MCCIAFDATLLQMQFASAFLLDFLVYAILYCVVVYLYGVAMSCKCICLCMCTCICICSCICICTRICICVALVFYCVVLLCFCHVMPCFVKFLFYNMLLSYVMCVCVAYVICTEICIIEPFFPTSIPSHSTFFSWLKTVSQSYKNPS